MLVETEAAVFETDDHIPLIQLLSMILEGRHEWRPAVPVADAAERFVRDKLPKTPALVEMVQKCLVESMHPGQPRSGHVRVDAKRLRDLVDDLAQPAAFVVEDGITEECFLLALAQAFGRDRIVLAKSKNWLVFAHAGGADRIGRFVAREQERFRLLGSARVAALIDSDRWLPRQWTSRHKMADKIRADGVDVHVWKCRHVESYIPTTVWKHHFPDQAEKIGMLLNMRSDQRGCLDIKHGLQRDLHRKGFAELFADLPKPILQEWRTGFKNDRNRMPAKPIPDGFPMSEADFAEFGEEAVDELRTVLAMIERVL